jgi:hypothetical protein
VQDRGPPPKGGSARRGGAGRARARTLPASMCAMIPMLRYLSRGNWRVAAEGKGATRAHGERQGGVADGRQHLGQAPSPPLQLASWRLGDERRASHGQCPVAGPWRGLTRGMDYHRQGAARAAGGGDLPEALHALWLQRKGVSGAQRSRCTSTRVRTSAGSTGAASGGACRYSAIASFTSLQVRAREKPLEAAMREAVALPEVGTLR